LYDLAISPQYVNDLRKEIEEIVGTEGWSKLSMIKMQKLDSFVKESIRLSPMSHGTSSLL